MGFGAGFGAGCGAGNGARSGRSSSKTLRGVSFGSTGLVLGGSFLGDSFFGSIGSRENHSSSSLGVVLIGDLWLPPDDGFELGTPRVVWGLARELDQRFAGPFGHGGLEDQVPVFALGVFRKAADRIVGDGDGAGFADFKIASVRTHCGQDAGQIPGGSIVRRWDVGDVSFGHRVVGHIAVVLEDALVGIGQVQSDLEAAPENGDIAQLDEFFDRRDVFGDVVFAMFPEDPLVVGDWGEGSGHDGDEFDFFGEQFAAREGVDRIGGGGQEVSKVR